MGEGGRVRTWAVSLGLFAFACAVLATGGCGGSSGKASSGGAPLTLRQVQSNLQKAGYRITVYSPNEGALTIDSRHKADAGFSIDASPSGQQLYASVYQASSATRAPSSTSASPIRG